MSIDMDRLAVALVASLAVTMTLFIGIAAVVALFTGGWYVTAGVIAFVALVVTVYRLAETER